MTARPHAAEVPAETAEPSNPRNFIKRGLAGLAVTAVVATGLVFVNTAAHADVPISGTVFLDYGGDGEYTAGVDTLLGGVTVTAYNKAGDPVGATKTLVNGTADAGNYVLPAVAAADEPLRIEFTDLPAGMHDTFMTSAGQTGVQFTTASSAAKVNYGVFDANQYSPVATGDEPNPLLATTIMVAGAKGNPAVSGEPVLVGAKWKASANVTGSDNRTWGADGQKVPAEHGSHSNPWAQRTTWATYGQVGSVFSTASDSNTGDLYAAASYKRYSELGEKGLGGIYVVRNAVNPATGEARSNAELTSFDVTALGINVGQDSIIGGPTAAGNAQARGLGAPNAMLQDNDAFKLAGKVGIGEIAVDADTRILYFVNLFDQKVYALDISDPASPKLAAAIATGATGNQHGYALTLHQGQLYAGFNDTGDTAFQSANDAGLKYYVNRVPALRSATDTFGSMQAVISGGDLGYAKGNPAHGWGGDPAVKHPQILRWNTWTDQWTSGSNSVGVGSDWGAIHVYPQPLVSGITFDREGYMVLGIMDRTQLQSGNRNCAADGACSTANADMYQTLASGDTLIAAPKTAEGDTKPTAYVRWAPEVNGVVGDRTSDHGGANEGPGNREFFEDRQWYPETEPNRGNHRENTLGSVVVIPGTQDELATNAYDPLEPIRAVGVQWFKLANGDRDRGYQHTWDPGDPALNAQRASFQKGGGMGGLALLAKAAPVEIGNRTWLDLNDNGVQDANEPSIRGVKVELYKADSEGKPTGVALGATTTDDNGNYFFRSEDAPGGTRGFVRDEATGKYGDYVVVFQAGAGADKVSLRNPDGSEYTGPQQFTWSQLLFAKAHQGGETAQAAERDSNAIPVDSGNGMPATIGHAFVSVGSAGQNDHSIDAGWKPGTVTVGNYVWNDADNNGIQDEENAGISGVALKIYLVEGDTQKELKTDAFGQPFLKNVTDADGLYLFEKLPVLKPGQTYKVEIDKRAASTVSALDGFVPTKTGQGTPESDSSTDFAVTKKAADVTTDETILNVPGRSDLTLDFGFFKAVPNGTIVKTDAEGNDANSESGAVDLAAAGGKATIEFTITNTGNEPLTNIAIEDVVVGSGTLGAITLATPDGDVVITRAKPWTGRLAVGQSLTAKAELTGVEAGVPHTDVATLWADGTLSGKPVVDPENPGTPEEPNRPNDPYNAKFDTYAIGDYVWIDKNRNGQQDGDEAPLADVVVNLLDAAGKPTGKTTKTDARGHYTFDELPAGTYKVQFVLPDGYVFTTANAENVPGGANSDANVTDGLTKVIELNAENTNLITREGVNATQGIDPTWDAGVVPPSVSVGDLVWQDLNNDGKQGTPEKPEPGIDGVTLTLTGPDGQPVKNVYGEDVTPVVTKNGGKYEFINLPVLKDGESYTVTISNVPDRFKPTTAGENNGAGADDSSTGSAVSGALTTDLAKDPTLDFGFVLKTPGAMINKADVSASANRDGNDPKNPVDLSSTQGATEIVFTVANNGEEPLTNIGLADVSSGSGAITYPIVVTTDKDQSFSLASAEDRWSGELAVGETATGRAQLTGVTAGKPHRNDVTLFAEGVHTKKPVEDPTNPSGDPEKPNRPTDPYNSVVKTYAIGDFVWLDSTPNGVQDKGEPGIAGVKVYLLDDKGNRIDGKVTETDTNGFYKFDNLGAGTYQVEFELPFGYVLVDPDQGSDDAKDSDALPTEGSNRTKGKTITVVLDDSNKSLEKREGVEASEGIDPTWDAGVRLATVSVGDKVWIDKNRDGRQDPNESGIDGVTLEIFNPKGEKVGETTTRDGGKYLFEGLPVLAEGESYTVKIDKEKSKGALKDLVPTQNGVGDREGDSSTWEATTEGLTKDGEKDLTLDFGFVAPSVSVGDRVWEDVNRDGLQPGEGESPERGISGVVLTIFGPDGTPVTDVFGNPVGPKTTDSEGNYLFPNLPALAEGQSYTVKIDRDASAEALKGFEPTKETEDSRENDSSTWSATTQGLTQNGEEDLTLDFGFIRAKVEIGDKVWKDNNRDGRQDENEPGLPGIVLVVTDEAGNPVKDINGKPVAPATTDADGNYRFVDLPVLPEGKSYVVTIDKSASQEALGNLIPTVSGAGDREGDSSEWTEKTQGLTKDGEQDLTLDFGFIVPKVSVGDRVWFDANKDGRQSFGEPGIVGVVLKLVGPDGGPVIDVFGKPVEPVKTDDNGDYLFENLPALAAGQSYKVILDAKASGDALKGLVPTTPGAGDREGDSSTEFATSEGLTKDGESDLTLDFGFVLVTVDTPVPPSLARTGSELFPVLPIGVGGLGLMLLGAGALLATRKRNQLSA